jgi:hypothetical protein
MPTFDDYGLEEYRLQADPQRIGPRHRREGRPSTGLRVTAATTAASLAQGARQGLRDGARAALALDVPTSTPTGTARFQRVWRTFQ